MPVATHTQSTPTSSKPRRGINCSSAGRVAVAAIAAPIPNSPPIQSIPKSSASFIVAHPRQPIPQHASKYLFAVSDGTTPGGQRRAHIIIN